MEVNCAGCAGCCLDWRPLVADSDRDAESTGIDHERRGPRAPLDDTYNLVALTRDEIRAFLEAGLGDVLTPRLWEADPDRDDDSLEIDGHRIAAVAGRPAFFVGLRKPPKPVAPFGREEPAWLPTCVFLDPSTLQCRIHGDDLYPEECADYPAHNLELAQETECERVEDAMGGTRLLDADPGDGEGLSELLFGPQAIGQKLFTHPEPDELAGLVDRVAHNEPTPADRAEFVATAAASSPGTFATSDYHYEQARARVLEADSWAGRAIDEWRRRVDEKPDTGLASAVEDARGAPPTPGWDALEGRRENDGGERND
ncbi:YkgJ family cysteine cluster protein [Natronoglomus mannanivorans]|uniref:YkgJ family cysteine cluster protein n=1 Tax=Natronoglomus mannanivorans TaxID=2979990 RepID=A0AAP3E2R0_9EURY|nr:YkgJ family cysteine cluster protein [Halobacteria archaeon AArc-xg1-1]